MSAHPHLPAEGFCIRNVNRDFVEWHRGRPRYVLWAIDTDLPAVQSPMEAAQAHLHGLLLDGYCRQPHITLKLCGFPSAHQPMSDEFGCVQLDREIASLQQAPIAPFDIAMGSLSSFSSAPYFSVKDTNGGIANLRTCLDASSGTQAYTPHITVGLYAKAWPVQSVRSRLAAFRPCPEILLRVARIGLFAYDASVIGGSLECLSTYDLEQKHLQWHGVPIF